MYILTKFCFIIIECNSIKDLKYKNKIFYFLINTVQIIKLNIKIYNPVNN